jgi:hypothetical protein
VHAGKIWETLGQLQRRGTRSTYHESGDHPIFGTYWLILNYPEDKKEGHGATYGSICALRIRFHRRISRGVPTGAVDPYIPLTEESHEVL